MCNKEKGGRGERENERLDVLLSVFPLFHFPLLHLNCIRVKCFLFPLRLGAFA